MVRLTQKQKQFYKENGYILLKNVLSGEELDQISLEYDELFLRKSQEKMESSWVGSDADDRKSDSAHTYHSALFGQFLYNKNLLDALEDVMGTRNIVLHHTKAHFKPPEKGAAYPMHQDYHYFPHKNDSMVAAFLHLDAANPGNGGLFVYPGSHKLGPLEDFGAKEGEYHYVDQSKFPLEKATPVVAERGDIVIFSYLLVHGSSPNRSSNRRRMLLAQLADAQDVPVGEQPTRPGQGWVLRGINVDRDASISKRFERTG
ncbi:phytanoyl-CoA dioxygenase, peroxisomal-like isoform X2 [Amyelois transitella]|uniref:phytanoyl-CoA dioxygenase, peroxisomal-like isoform X2 n=1 Tax=Amyelois transitella TaxID=680683 RepID=UPI00298F96DF|nr:phytanoyl-CoA dioxygenase, peroxisomal-like isoform X2 [Amyelois transitella]